MATIHISQADAARSLDRLIDQVRNGSEVVIESGSTAVAVMRAVSPPLPRLLSESLRIARQRGSKVTLDEEFGNDLETGIQSSQEPTFNPWD